MVADTAQRIKDELHRVIVGKDELIETLFSCLLAEGHILVEGNPGLAKTTITKLFAQTLGCTFNRQQFTPDLLPADIIGSYVFDQKTGEFYVRKGGIFANIVMVDELNRATPRTQSALLEAMEERNVTIEGTTFPLEKPFMVLATQTMVNLEGTFPLPEVQLDRFYVKMTLDYPSTDEELQILNVKLAEALAIAQVTDREAILRMIDVVRNVYVDEKVLEYIRDIVVSTRNHKDLVLPASPRASIALLGYVEGARGDTRPGLRHTRRRQGDRLRRAQSSHAHLPRVGNRRRHARRGDRRDSYGGAALALSNQVPPS